MTGSALTIDVFHGDDFIAIDGVLVGDPLGFADELVMDDIYALTAQATPQQLHLLARDDGFCLRDMPQHPVHLDCCLTLMAPDGTTHEALVLVEEDAGMVAAIHLLALGELEPQIPYRLVGITRQTATRRFAEAASGSFARGTHIAMASGAMKPIETLAAGDLIMTRDAGKQPVRHIIQTTLRATGSFAPVVISKGTLHNDNDLVLRPDHRIFVYQRIDALGAGRAEVLIKARQLVDGHSVIRRSGGFVDYFQLIMDDHHIIYAEGIAAESHLVDGRTKAALPSDARTTNHSHKPHMDYEVQDSLIDPRTAASLLRRASAS
jgi:hypothetical protein